MRGAGHGDQEGSRGSVRPKIHGKPQPKISSQTAFRYPGYDGRGPRRAAARQGNGPSQLRKPREVRSRNPRRPIPEALSASRSRGSSIDSPGYLKAVWPEIFAPAFQGLSAESDPRDPHKIAGALPAHQLPRRISSADKFDSEYLVDNFLGLKHLRPLAEAPPTGTWLEPISRAQIISGVVK